MLQFTNVNSLEANKTSQAVVFQCRHMSSVTHGN